MNGKELYEEHKGKKAFDKDWGYSTGIIVGHDDRDMIMAIVEGQGWDKIDYLSDVIYDMKNNEKGYLYVGETQIL